MSFDLFVVCVKDGLPATIARQDLDRSLAAYVAHREAGLLRLRFADGESTLYRADGERIGHFSINRPSAAPEFHAALLALLRAENLVLLVPGECPPLVGRAAMIAHVPADIVEAAGPPVVLADAQEILPWIRRA
jgi:hypothetical protein